MSEKLAKSDLRVLKPLGSPGHRAYGAITTELRNRLGEECAKLLAEPVASEFGNEIDWYSPTRGISKKLTELDPESRDRAFEKFLNLRNRILELAKELEASSSNEDLRLAEAFRNAMRVPNEEDCIYLVYSNDGLDFQPVLINWAHDSDEPSIDSNTGLVVHYDHDSQAPPKKETPKEKSADESNEEKPGTQDTKSTKAKSPKTKRSNTKSTRTKRTKSKNSSTTKTTNEISGISVSKPSAILLLWILLAMLILAIIWLLLAPCGINIGSALNHCPSYSNAQINAEYRRELLQNRKNMLERELTLLNSQCVPIQNSRQEIPQLEPDPEPDVDVQPDTEPEIIEIEQGKNTDSDPIETDQGNPTLDSIVIIERIDEIEVIEGQSKEDESIVALENDNAVVVETDETDSTEESSNEIVATDSTEKDSDGTLVTDESDTTESKIDGTVESDETNPIEKNSDQTSETEEINTTEESSNVASEEDEADGTEEDSENTIEHADSNEEINDPEVDEEFEERLSSRGATHGDLTISLLWHTKSDLDLILICPSKENISFLNKEVTVKNCEGFLELDANVYESSLIDEPVEHIYVNTPEQGEYKVRVYMSGNRDDGSPVEFKVKIQHLGEEKTLSGSLTENDSTWDHEFKIESAK